MNSKLECLLNNRNLTILISHPDDEVIFGWCVWNYTKKVICCSNDKYNTEHPEWKDRHLALKEVCDYLGLELVCLDYNSDFSKLPENELVKLVNRVSELIRDDFVVFTHNAWGEYGHPDHVFINNLAKRNKKEIIVSDTRFNFRYLKYELCPECLPVDRKLVVNKNREKYTYCENIYRKYNCWTWKEMPKNKTNLYIENER